MTETSAHHWQLVGHHGITTSFVAAASVAFSTEQPTRRVRFADSVEREHYSPPSHHLQLTAETICELLEKCAAAMPNGVWNLAHQNYLLWKAELVHTSDTTSPREFVSLDYLLKHTLDAPEADRLNLMSSIATHVVLLGQVFPSWHSMRKDILLPKKQYSLEVDLRCPHTGLPHLQDPSLPGTGESVHHFHSHPFLLDLGVLLLEIQYGTDIGTMKAEEMTAENTAPSLYNDYVKALSIVTGQKFERTVARGCAGAIRACLTCDFLPVDCSTDSKLFKRLVREHIVLPLQLQAAVGFATRLDLEDWDESDGEGEGAEDGDSSIFAKCPQEEAPVVQKPCSFESVPIRGSQKWTVFDTCPDKSTRVQSSQMWFQRLSAYHKRIILPLDPVASQNDHNERRTKIAVLDTGIDLLDPYLKGAHKGGRIREMRNFVPDLNDSVDSEDVRDESGHGTHVAALALKVAPLAEICVARVFRHDTLAHGEHVVGQAIIWAAETCGADIITMSFGFPGRSDIVGEAIMRAYGRQKYGTIMLAATNNSGRNDNIAYPASDHNVIGVFACNGSGNPADFTAKPPGEDRYFMTLGEAVESSWPRSVKQDGDSGSATVAYKSGTSFATPIAAGLAANILDVARYGIRLGPELMSRLHSLQGMAAALRLMAGLDRDGYRYLAPWKLWKRNEASTEEQFERERNHIYYSIQEELDTL